MTRSLLELSGSTASITNARSTALRALVLVAAFSTPAFGQFRDWQTGNGTWGSNFSWSPIGVPAATDIARIGFHANAQNATVTLDQSDTVAGLQVTDGMTLDLGGSQLVVNGATLISGFNAPGKSYFPSTIRVEPGLAAAEFHAQNVSLDNSGLLLVTDGAVARIDGEATVATDGRMGGHGAFNFTSDGVRALNNNGRMSVSNGSLTLNQQGDAQLDLDGTSGNGWIMANWLAEYAFTVNGTSLTDAFSGEIHLASGCSLVMNLDDPWEADASSIITAYGYNNPYPQGMRLDGAPVTLAGEVLLTGNDALFRVLADADIESTATFEVNQGCHLRFEGDTDMDGGSFATASSDMADGGVTFAGPTSWTGDVTINGAARQNANAAVLAATTITADEFDLDGGGGVSPSTWTINQLFTLNAQRIDQDGSGNDAGTFDGTMNISGGLLSRFTYNAPTTGGYWWMDGTLNLGGDLVLFSTRLAGSRMHLTGDLNVTAGRVAIDSEVRVYGSAQVNVGPASAILRMAGNTIIYGGEFTGAGTIQNVSSGNMHISEPLDIGQLDLVNAGELTLSYENILVAVDRFEQSPGGGLNITVSGPAPGIEHDMLMVSSGIAQLDGELRVELPALGGVQFYPQAGDQFVILTADGGIAGAFDADPVTQVDDLTFQWAVDYYPFNVTLRLVSVTPSCPGDANGDGMVNGLDLSVLLSQFGSSVEPWSGADLNGDGQVIGADLSVLLANFGDVCLTIGQN